MMKKSWAHIMNSAAMELSLHESVQSIVNERMAKPFKWTYKARPLQV